MYDFHKIRNDKNDYSFYHSRFMKGKIHLLKLIKRKRNIFSNETKIEKEKENDEEKRKKIIVQLKEIEQKQKNIEKKFDSFLKQNSQLNKKYSKLKKKEKYLQIVYLLLLAKYDQSNPEFKSEFLNLISSFNKETLSKIIEEHLSQIGLNHNDIIFEIKNKKMLQKSHNKINENSMFDYVEEANSISQCFGTTPTMSPPRISPSVTLNDNLLDLVNGQNFSVNNVNFDF